MTLFSEGFSSRPDHEIVVACGDEHLTASRGVRLLPAPETASTGEPLRLALCLRSPVRLIEMLSAYDGHADALLMLDPGLPCAAVEAIAAEQRCGRIITDRDDVSGAAAPQGMVLETGDADAARTRQRRGTEWIMTTSGTTGQPKAVRHNLQSLARTVREWDGAGSQPVWGLTYEPTRFAGMQVVLQAVLGGGKLIAPNPDRASLEERIRALAAGGCTHMSATPTFWRRILMHPSSDGLDPRQITLGGEIADQGILDALRARFPHAQITHIYASTEAGVGFSVKDGREGFPLDYVTAGVGSTRLKIENGHLWIGGQGSLSAEPGLSDGGHGFVDTLDSVAVEGDRVYFLGRDTGVINVGGAKVYPEQVEQVISAMPQVVLARVIPKRNPFSGAILVAEVMPANADIDAEALQRQIVRHCRSLLPAEAVPAVVRVCDELAVNGAGKIIRI